MPVGGPNISQRDLAIQIRRGHRAAVVLADAPPDGGIGRGQRLGHLGEQHRPQFRAAEEARLQHAEETAIDQRGHHVLGQFAATLDLVAGFLQHRRQIACALDEVDALTHLRISADILIVSRET